MNILPKLPEHLFDKVMLFNSHPAADLVKESMVFHYYRLQNEHMGIHGSPFDRGQADGHYERMFYPHRWTNGNGLDGGTVYNLTTRETDAYMLGYFGTSIRRWRQDEEGSLRELLNRVFEN